MVARMVWPAMVILLILAVAGPCLTFYLLIKDYWAEVSSLRRDLLFCQLGSTDLPLPLNLDLEFPTAASFPPPMPQAPQRLVATTSSSPTQTSISNTFGSVSTDTGMHTSSSSPTTDGSLVMLSNVPDDSTTKPRQKITELSSTAPVSGSTIHSATANISKAATITNTTIASPSVESLTQVPMIPTNSFPVDSGIINPKPTDNAIPLDTQESLSSPQNYPSPLPKPSSAHIRENESKLRSVARPPFRPSIVQNPIRGAASGYLGDIASRGRDWVPTRPPRSLDRIMSDDDPNTIDTTVADQEYVALLERQLRDLRARVKACRSCLTPPQRTKATCGGGTAWREHRKRERQLRNRQRAQRRERRQRIKKLTSNNTTTAAPTTTTTEEADPIKNPLQADVISWFSESDMKTDSHRARQNHRMSTDFRRGFNQKISRMDEALMQFTDTQAAFCKELRDNLGGRLEKRGQELGALSNQIAALVRTSTSQINELEKVASDQLYSSQASIEKSIAVTQAIRDSQIRAIQSYHKQTFLPAAVAIATILSDQASAATSMGVELITKVEMLQDIYLTYATQQADTLQKVTEDVDMFASKHTNLVMRTKDHANHLNINTEAFIRELQTRMNNVVKELVQIRLQSQNFVSLNNNTHNDIFDSLNKTEGSVDDLSQGIRHRIHTAKDNEQDFRNTFKMETNQISDRVESGISQALVSNHASVSQIEDTELDTRVFVGSAVSAWNELYMNQEAELREESDSLTNSLRSHTHHTQNILADLRSAAETHEQVLEEQRMDFQRFVRRRQDALDNQCSAITDWAMLMSSELRRRDEDLHRFLNEDLQYTTVTLHEDTDGYLVSRLPDGSLVYQSSPAHAAHLPPNVTYQLEETAYSTEPASSTSHSSLQKPQLEETVVTSVNSTQSSLKDSINLGDKDNSKSNSSKTDNETNSTYEEQPDDGWKLTEKYDVLEEQNNRIRDVFTDDKEEIDFSHHSKTTRSEGSSQQDIRTAKDNVTNTRATTDMNEKGSRDPSETTRTLYQTSVVSEKTINVSSLNTEGVKRHGELGGSKSRQNDGTYEPYSSTSCGGMPLLFNSSNGQGPVNNIFYDEEDKGIRKLRKILREAQRTIEKFQMDFQIDDSFRKNKPPLRLWEKLKDEEALEDILDELGKGDANDTSSPPDFEKPLNTYSNAEQFRNSRNISSTSAADPKTPLGHRVRHQHHKSFRRMQSHSRDHTSETLKEEEALDSTSDPPFYKLAFDTLHGGIHENTTASELEDTLVISSKNNTLNSLERLGKRMHEIKEIDLKSSNETMDGDHNRTETDPILAVRHSKKKTYRQENETTPTSTDDSV